MVRQLLLTTAVSLLSAGSMMAAAPLVLAPGVKISTENGLKKLSMVERQHAGKISVGPSKKGIRKAGPAKVTAPDGYVLYESFENWDGEDYTWTPEGWTVEMNGEVDRDESWTPADANPFLPGPSEGEYYYGINYSDGQQDEWLISPFVSVPEGMDLSYWIYLDPFFLYNLENFDWDEWDWVGDREVAANLEILVQVEDEEWVKIRDYAEEYMEYTAMDLAMATPNALEKHQVSLAGYAGNTLRVAFRYVGTDGNTMFIDAIGIGYPELTGISYMAPFETLYWGFTREWNLSGLTAAIAQYPINAALTWTNMSDEEAEFTWTYGDPDTGGYTTSDDPDFLTVTYYPRYNEGEVEPDNLFYAPVLKATAEHATPGEYQDPYAYFQTGGAPVRTLNDGSDFEACLIPFNYINSGVSITTVTDDEIGDISIPVFGHSPNTDQYWLNYTMNGAEPEGNDYSKLIGIANLFMPSAEAPLVVNGVTVYGYGQINDAAELKATIYGLDADMSNDYESFAVIAQATISGSEILREYSDSKGYLCLPFDFETPAVIQSTEEHPAYFIMFEGFNSDEVPYFAPMQSKDPDPNYICWGYILNHIDVSATTGRPAYYSMKPMVYKENGEYVDPYSAFAIGLNAEYPWLSTSVDEVVLSGSEITEVAMDSFYEGSELTIEAPAGVTASATGRYNQCVLSAVANDAAVVIEGDIVIKAPGVEVRIPVTYDPSGVASLEVAGKTIASIYDMTGRSIAQTDLAKGVYVVMYTDGTVRKVVK